MMEIVRRGTKTGALTTCVQCTGASFVVLGRILHGAHGRVLGFVDADDADDGGGLIKLIDEIAHQNTLSPVHHIYMSMIFMLCNAP